MSGLLLVWQSSSRKLVWLPGACATRTPPKLLYPTSCKRSACPAIAGIAGFVDIPWRSKTRGRRDGAGEGGGRALDLHSTERAARLSPEHLACVRAAMAPDQVWESTSNCECKIACVRVCALAGFDVPRRLEVDWTAFLVWGPAEGSICIDQLCSHCRTPHRAARTTPHTSGPSIAVVPQVDRALAIADLSGAAVDLEQLRPFGGRDGHGRSQGRQRRDADRSSRLAEARAQARAQQVLDETLREVVALEVVEELEGPAAAAAAQDRDTRAGSGAARDGDGWAAARRTLEVWEAGLVHSGWQGAWLESCAAEAAASVSSQGRLAAQAQAEAAAAAKAAAEAADGSNTPVGVYDCLLEDLAWPLHPLLSSKSYLARPGQHQRRRHTDLAAHIVQRWEQLQVRGMLDAVDYLAAAMTAATAALTAGGGAGAAGVAAAPGAAGGGGGPAALRAGGHAAGWLYLPPASAAGVAKAQATAAREAAAEAAEAAEDLTALHRVLAAGYAAVTSSSPRAAFPAAASAGAGVAGGAHVPGVAGAGAAAAGVSAWSAMQLRLQTGSVHGARDRVAASRGGCGGRGRADRAQDEDVPGPTCADLPAVAAAEERCAVVMEALRCEQAAALLERPGGSDAAAAGGAGAAASAARNCLLDLDSAAADLWNGGGGVRRLQRARAKTEAEVPARTGPQRTADAGGAAGSAGSAGGATAGRGDGSLDTYAGVAEAMAPGLLAAHPGSWGRLLAAADAAALARAEAMAAARARGKGSDVAVQRAARVPGVVQLADTALAGLSAVAHWTRGSGGGSGGGVGGQRSGPAGAGSLPLRRFRLAYVMAAGAAYECARQQAQVSECGLLGLLQVPYGCWWYCVILLLLRLRVWLVRLRVRLARLLGMRLTVGCW